MASAFVLINTNPGTELTVLETLRRFSEITESYSLYGVYDLVVKVTTDNFRDLDIIIEKRIRRLRSVRSTLTMRIVNGWLQGFPGIEATNRRRFFDSEGIMVQ